jgi:hypothetical protein
MRCKVSPVSWTQDQADHRQVLLHCERAYHIEKSRLLEREPEGVAVMRVDPCPPAKDRWEIADKFKPKRSDNQL